MIGLRTNQNAIPHASQRCSTLMSPSPALTWPTGAMSSLWQVGHRRSRVSGNSASGVGMGPQPSMAGEVIGVALSRCSPGCDRLPE